MTWGVVLRDPEAAASARHDLIVIGGGIQGIMLALEATRRRLRPLLLERADFGAGTTYNSLRILHGGLRYLKSLDLARFRESVRERAFWLREFPDLARPVGCLMPLAGNGPYRPGVFRMALALNDRLVRTFDSIETMLAGRIVDPGEVRELAPGLDVKGCKGAALWHDAWAPHAPRLCIEALRWACREGAVALNHVEALELIRQAGGGAGVRARDRESQKVHEFRAPLVINAAGPAVRRFIAHTGLDDARLFEPVLAWNLLFRRQPASRLALALRAPRRGAHTFFAVPWPGGVCVGTGYASWGGGRARPTPSEAEIEAFITGLNEAAPGLAFDRRDVTRVYAGLLPAAADGRRLSDRPVVVDHAQRGFPGVWSVSGVKLTTARALAQHVLDRALPDCAPVASFHRVAAGPREAVAATLALPDWRAQVDAALSEEAAVHLDDILLRRTTVGEDPDEVLALAPEVCRRVGWDCERSRIEVDRLRAAFGLGPVPPKEGGRGRHPADHHRGAAGERRG